MKKRVNGDADKLERKTKDELSPRIHLHGYLPKPFNRHVYTYDRLRAVLHFDVAQIRIIRISVRYEINKFPEPRLSILAIIITISQI